MSDSRPIMELDFVMIIARNPLPPWAESFVFPLAVFEQADSQMLLFPLSVAASVYADFGSILTRLMRESAYVSIPYHPPLDEDPHIYGFGVYLAWIPIDHPAIGEMLLLQQYSQTLWRQYRRLAVPLGGV